MNAHCWGRAIALAALLFVFVREAVAQPVVGVLGIAGEIAPIERRLQDSREVNVRGYVFRVGTLNGRTVVVGRSGAGKVNAAIIATLLIGEFKPSVMLFSGTAGAIDPALQPGDVVIGTSVAQHDAGVQTSNGIRPRGMRNAVTGGVDPVVVQAPESLLAVARRSAKELRLPSIRTPNGEDRSPRIVEGVIVTGDVFLADSARRETLRSELGAAAVEMEGAAVVQTCRQFGVSCLVIRSVTDRADPQALVSYERFLATASEHAAALVAEIIARLESGTVTSDSGAAVRAAREQWNAALERRDRSALEYLVEDTAVHVAPRFTHVGRTDFLQVFFQNMEARPQFRLTYEPDRVTMCERAGCDVATEYGRWRETWLEAGEATEVSGTYYALWRRHEDAWQLRSEVFATQVCRGRRYCGS